MPSLITPKATAANETMSHEYVLGIDVGGTDVKVGLFDYQGQIVASDRTPTPSLGTPIAVFEHALRFGNDALGSETTVTAKEHSHIAAVGLAVPGVLDQATCQLKEVVNLPGWLNVPLLDQMQAQSGLPCAVLNDANAAALAEHAMRNLGHQSLALVTLGTGIGCGLVLGGRPHGGDHGCAGELGHIAIDFGDAAWPCTCGSRGHLETYAGAAGVQRRLKDRIADGVAANEPADITPREIARRAEAGDPDCIATIRETAAYVGRAIGMLCQSVDPAVVLLGGAMTFGGPDRPTGRKFLDDVIAEVRATTLVQVGTQVTIDFASLKNNAGMIGAAKFASLAAQIDHDAHH
ncbi:ROK family protein [Crateriforma spongiae]|uniref:ROK family protein n=1 Tax=Crateriforma spongiae TaxID=2724528 RepID=UPI001F21EF5E|nr:ROK family protein [Crateriforma spongiae]